MVGRETGFDPRGARPVVVATGLTRGIGLALAKEMRGAVDFVSLQRDGSVAPVEGALAIAFDLSESPSEARTRRLASDLDSALAGRPVWGLIHCAGVLGPVGRPGGGAAGTAAYALDFEEAMRVNVTAAVELLAATEARLAPRAPDGRAPFVLHLSSGAATNPYVGWEAYCASKAAVRMLFRAWAKRFEASRLVALSVTPGRVMTDMMERVLASDPCDFPDVGGFREAREQGAIVEPAVPARAIARLLLSSDAAEYASVHGRMWSVSRGIVEG